MAEKNINMSNTNAFLPIVYTTSESDASVLKELNRNASLIYNKSPDNNGYSKNNSTMKKKLSFEHEKLVDIFGDTWTYSTKKAIKNKVDLSKMTPERFCDWPEMKEMMLKGKSSTKKMAAPNIDVDQIELVRLCDSPSFSMSKNLKCSRALWQSKYRTKLSSVSESVTQLKRPLPTQRKSLANKENKILNKKPINPKPTTRDRCRPEVTPAPVVTTTPTSRKSVRSAKLTENKYTNTPKTMVKTATKSLKDTSKLPLSGKLKMNRRNDLSKIDEEYKKEDNTKCSFCHKIEDKFTLILHKLDLLDQKISDLKNSSDNFSIDINDIKTTMSTIPEFLLLPRDKFSSDSSMKCNLSSIPNTKIFTEIPTECFEREGRSTSTKNSLITSESSLDYVSCHQSEILTETPTETKVYQVDNIVGVGLIQNISDLNDIFDENRSIIINKIVETVADKPSLSEHNAQRCLFGKKNIIQEPYESPDSDTISEFDLSITTPFKPKTIQWLLSANSDSDTSDTISVNVTPSIADNTQYGDTMSKTLQSYNNLKEKSILCSPKYVDNYKLLMTPSAKLSNRKLISRRVQQQLYLLNETATTNSQCNE